MNKKDLIGVAPPDSCYILPLFESFQLSPQTLTSKKSQSYCTFEDIWPMDFVIIIKWLLPYATKFGKNSKDKGNKNTFWEIVFFKIVLIMFLNTI